MKKPNPLHTVLLALAALSLVAIAIVEISGISTTALFHKFNPEAAAAATTKPAAMAKTRIEFEETHYSFGKVRNGDKVQHVYRFKNAGDKPLLISKVEAGCGCTAPSFTKEPVSPGATGEVTVVFNSTNRGGFQEKSVTVHSNAQDAVTKLSFDADVSPDVN